MAAQKKKQDIPVYKKFLLTIPEAASYYNIGASRIEAMLKEDDCPFVFMSGNRRLVKREEFDNYIRTHKEL